jgi:glycosyltransferase involved in cell wall biosynthesis
MRQPARPNVNSGRIGTFLVCSGLGHVRRGYEAFMRECFEALRGDPRLEVRLFKGAGAEAPNDITVANLARSSLGARAVGELTRRGPYVVEQASFTAMLLRHLVRNRPDVIYYCDPTVGKLLWYWRRATGARFRLLFHNGGPHLPPFRWCDHVHQLTPSAMDDAVTLGHPPSRQTLIPCGFRFGSPPPRITPEERTAIRAQLGFPPDRPVVLSVGALNRVHKRMDYLISEIAALPSPRPFLVMLGEAETETPAVRATAELLLGPRGFAMRTVSRDQMEQYYRAADVFVLASLREAFGLAYVEAMANGLPCIAHDGPVTRFVLGEYGRLADLRRPGALGRELRTALAVPDPIEARLGRHYAVVSRFGWPAVVHRYVAMIAECAGKASPVVETRTPHPRVAASAGAV